jgi:hypothetical protein
MIAGRSITANAGWFPPAGQECGIVRVHHGRIAVDHENRCVLVGAEREERRRQIHPSRRPESGDVPLALEQPDGIQSDT